MAKPVNIPYCIYGGPCSLSVFAQLISSSFYYVDSAVSDEFMLPGSDNMGPSMLELREIPRSNSLVLGHNGFGAFCLWYALSLYTFYSRYTIRNFGMYLILDLLITVQN